MDVESFTTLSLQLLALVTAHTVCQLPALPAQGRASLPSSQGLSTALLYTIYLPETNSGSTRFAATSSMANFTKWCSTALQEERSPRVIVLAVFVILLSEVYLPIIVGGRITYIGQEAICQPLSDAGPTYVTVCWHACPALGKQTAAAGSMMLLQHIMCSHAHPPTAPGLVLISCQGPGVPSLLQLTQRLPLGLPPCSTACTCCPVWTSAPHA